MHWLFVGCQQTAVGVQLKQLLIQSSSGLLKVDGRKCLSENGFC